MERKEASSRIRFGTQRTKVLTSAICMGRIQLAMEWKKVKMLNKKPLQKLMVQKYNFSEIDVKKKLPDLRKMIETHLLVKEADLVKIFEEKLASVPIDLPPEIKNFFQNPRPEPKPAVEHEAEPTVEPEQQKGDDLEAEIENFLVENFVPDFENLQLLANSVWMDLLLESEADGSEEKREVGEEG